AFRPLASALGVSVEEAALGVIRLANANMIHLLKLVSVRRGRDPRDFALIAFGGGGSMHAAVLARELQLRRLIVPRHPGHFSAWGMLTSQLRHDAVQTRVARSNDLSNTDLEALWHALEERLLETFAHEAIPQSKVTFARSADFRYAGQEHTVTV